MIHRCFQTLFLQKNSWILCQRRLIYILGSSSTWRFHIQKQNAMLMSSHRAPTEISPTKFRKKSIIPIINWIYDDVLKGTIKMNAFFLYADITRQVNYLNFFNVCQLDDTFNSWFLVTELHVWMLMARLRGDGRDGRAASSSLVAALWDDTTSRSKALAPGDSSIAKKQVQILSSEFRASLLIYDDGLLSSDTVLASAIWFRLLSKSCDDPRLLELLTVYVRDQMHNLENTPKEDLLLRATAKWKPLPTHIGQS